MSELYLDSIISWLIFIRQDDQGFSRSLIERLLGHLEAVPLPHLTPNEHAHLLVLIQAMLEVDDSRRALDSNGFRYLISMRSFYILNKRAEPSSPDLEGGISHRTGWRARLRYRDITWAFHSETQELLLSASLAACQDKMTWSDARALGVFLWLHSVESMVRKVTAVIELTIHLDTLTEIAHGSRCADGIHGWRLPRSSCLFLVLLRSWKTEVGSGTLATGRMA